MWLRAGFAALLAAAARAQMSMTGCEGQTCACSAALPRPCLCKADPVVVAAGYYGYPVSLAPLTALEQARPACSATPAGGAAGQHQLCASNHAAGHVRQRNSRRRVELLHL